MSQQSEIKIGDIPYDTESIVKEFDILVSKYGELKEIEKQFRDFLDFEFPQLVNEKVDPDTAATYAINEFLPKIHSQDPVYEGVIEDVMHFAKDQIRAFKGFIKDVCKGKHPGLVEAAVLSTSTIAYHTTLVVAIVEHAVLIVGINPVIACIIFHIYARQAQLDGIELLCKMFN